MAVWPARHESTLGLAGGPSQHQACPQEPAGPLAQPSPLSSKALGAPEAALSLCKSCCQSSSEGAVGKGWGEVQPLLLSPQALTGRRTSWGCLGLCCVLLGSFPCSQCWT